MIYYSCDFETTTDPADCRVWLWEARNLYDPTDRHRGINIESFIEWVLSLHGCQLSFHNLKFDGQFIVSHLLKIGWEWTTDKKVRGKRFSTLISDKGAWYTIVIGQPKGCIKVVDSLKLLPFSIERIAVDFHLPMLKGSIDYTMHREEGYMPTANEIQYIDNDVDIAAEALKALYDDGMKRLTIGSCALNFYKGMCRHFDGYFPKPDYDADVRQGYRGGWTFANPLFQGQDIGEGIVLDVNSLYPWAMSECMLPYGAGVWKKGQLTATKYYPLFIQHLSCQFELKPHHVPTIQIHGNPNFNPTEYLASSHGLIVDLCLSSVDLALFLEHYDVYNLEYHSGWLFKGKAGIFRDYVAYWTKEKVQAKKAGNYARYILSKLMLNNLYGKFSTNPHTASKEPVLQDDGSVKYSIREEDPKEPVYIPVGIFVTSWARDKTIRAAQKLIDRFLYADTDSLHLIGTEIPEDLQVDPYILGAWDHEASFKRARYLHAKCYIEDMYAEPDDTGKLHYVNYKTDYSKLKVTVAGLPAHCHEQVTWDNFGIGARYEGKLKPRIVPGGVVLEDIPFEIRRCFVLD